MSDPYEGKRPHYEAAGDEVVTWLRAEERKRMAEHQAGAPEWVISSRLKTAESIATKIERKQRARPGYRLDDLTDIMGVRAVVESQSCARALVAYLDKYAGYEIRETEDFSATPRVDGYRGIHLILGVDSRLSNRGATLPRVAVELQVRTILQHQWSVLSHNEFYKQVEAIPPSLLSRMRTLGEALAGAEHESDQLRRGRVLDECSARIRRALRSHVIERLATHPGDGREIGEVALHLFELDQQVRRVLVSDGDDQRRAVAHVLALASWSDAPGWATEVRDEVAEVAGRVHALVVAIPE